MSVDQVGNFGGNNYVFSDKRYIKFGKYAIFVGSNNEVEFKKYDLTKSFPLKVNNRFIEWAQKISQKTLDEKGGYKDWNDYNKIFSLEELKGNDVMDFQKKAVDLLIQLNISAASDLVKLLVIALIESQFQKQFKDRYAPFTCLGHCLQDFIFHLDCISGFFVYKRYVDLLVMVLELPIVDKDKFPNVMGLTKILYDHNLDKNFEQFFKEEFSKLKGFDDGLDSAIKFSNTKEVKLLGLAILKKNSSLTRYLVNNKASLEKVLSGENCIDFFDPKGDSQFFQNIFNQNQWIFLLGLSIDKNKGYNVSTILHSCDGITKMLCQMTNEQLEDNNTAQNIINRRFCQLLHFYGLLLDTTKVSGAIYFYQMINQLEIFLDEDKNNKLSNIPLQRTYETLRKLNKGWLDYKKNDGTQIKVRVVNEGWDNQIKRFGHGRNYVFIIQKLKDEEEQGYIVICDGGIQFPYEGGSNQGVAMYPIDAKNLKTIASSIPDRINQKNQILEIQLNSYINWENPVFFAEKKQYTGNCQVHNALLAMRVLLTIFEQFETEKDWLNQDLEQKFFLSIPYTNFFNRLKQDVTKDLFGLEAKIDKEGVGKLLKAGFDDIWGVGHEDDKRVFKALDEAKKLFEDAKLDIFANMDLASQFLNDFVSLGGLQDKSSQELQPKLNKQKESQVITVTEELGLNKEEGLQLDSNGLAIQDNDGQSDLHSKPMTEVTKALEVLDSDKTESLKLIATKNQEKEMLPLLGETELSWFIKQNKFYILPVTIAIVAILAYVLYFMNRMQVLPNNNKRDL